MDQVKKAVAEAVACHGRIDVLVNNAGMVVFGQEEDFTAFQDLSEESWDFGIAINLKTQFNVTRCVVPGMIERGYGRIVNISSVTGPVVANPDEAVYCAAKAGVLGMTRGPGARRGQARRHRQRRGPRLDRHGLAGRGRGRGRPQHAAWDAPRILPRSASSSASSAPTTPATSPASSSSIDGGNTIQEYKGPSELYY